MHRRFVFRWSELSLTNPNAKHMLRPRSVAPATEAGRGHSLTPRVTQMQSANGQGNGNGAAIRVLVADDDPNVRSTLVRLLETLGHLVVGDVASGREAVAAAEAATPDVVLLDVNMPDGSGVEAAREITQARPGTAVVLFSGDPTVELTDADVAASAAISFLPKPAPARLVDTTLRIAVARARELTEARSDAAKAREQLEGRKIIERAKGILMRRTGSSEQEAYRILQRTSQDRSVSMVEIAKAVLESEPGTAASGKER